MITKFNLAHVKIEVRKALKHHPYTQLFPDRVVPAYNPSGHNDGGTLFVTVGYGVAGLHAAACIARTVKIDGVETEVKHYERPGSIAQQEAWKAAGVLNEYYVVLTKEVK